MEADIDPVLGGELNLGSGAISVRFPAGALNAAHRIRLERSTATTAKDDPARQLVVYQFSLRAFARAAPAKETKQFKKPVTITVRYEQSVIKGWKEPDLALVYWDVQKKRWLTLPSQVDTAKRTVTAQTTHFSDFGLTTAPDILSYLPNLDGTQTTLFTGAASTHYTLELPPGRNELVPKLALSYSSTAVDMMDETKQASFVGAGWSFSTSYIARDTRSTYQSTDDVFSLVSDGAGYDLVIGVDGYYHATQEQYWRISYDSGNNRWLVIMNDGTQYQYGYSANSRAQNWRIGDGLKQETYAWWLEKVIDTHGNEIAYTYLHDQGGVICGGQVVNYDAALYPQTIRYNGKTQTGFLTEIVLTYTPRTDYYYYTSKYQCGTLLQSQKLERVDISTTVASTMQLVRRYAFSYDYSTFPGMWHHSGVRGRLTLKQITRFGTDASSTLPPYTLTYTDNRLSQATNGIGGTVAFAYDYVTFNDAYRYYYGWDFTGCATPWTGWPCSSNWTAHNASVSMGVHGDPYSAMYITSNGSGYVALRSDYFLPGAIHALRMAVHPIIYTTSQVRVTAFDGVSEKVVRDWITCPDYLNSCDVGGTFLVSPAASQLEIRVYVQNTVALRSGQIDLIATYYRVTHRTIQDGQGASATYAYAYTGAALNNTTISTSANTWNPRYSRNTQFRGHSKVTMTDPMGAKTEHYFAQDDVFLGHTTEIVRLGDANEKYTRTVNTYANACIPVVNYTGVHVNSCTGATLPTSGMLLTGIQANFVYLSRTIEETYNGQITSKAAKTEYGYDAYGNLRQVDEYGEGASVYRRTAHTFYPNTTAWILNKVGLTQVFDSGSNRISETRYSYDGSANYTTPPTKGDLTRVDVTADGVNYFPRARNTYDTYGNLLSTMDARNNTTTMQYDSVYFIFPTTVTNAAGHVTTNTYNYRLGKLATTTDPNGATTSYTYDVLGRTTSIKLPLEQASANATVLYEYTLGNPRSRVRVQVRNDLGGTNPATYQNAWWFYDGLGRVIQQQTQGASGQIILVNTEYDTRGQIKRVSNPYAVSASGGTYQTPNWGQPVTTYEYDPIKRVKKTINPDATFQTIGYNQWTATLTDANGHQKQTIADAFGRTIQVKEFNAGNTYTTQYAYDRLNRLTQVTDHAGNVTTMTYDWLGRKTAMSDPDMGTWGYAYDNAGNLTRQTDAKNQTTCFYYDGLNRLKGKNYRSDVNCPTTDPGTYTVRHWYDQGTNGIGRRTRIDDPSGWTTWAYDSQGRLLSQTNSITGAPSAYTTSWTYDAMSRVRTMTYPDGEVVTTTYNDQMLPQTLGAYVTSAQYSAAGQLTTLALGNGVTTTYTYHPQNLRLTQLTTSGNLQNLSYLYDNVGNITRITDTVRNETLNFAYDHLDRLTSVTGAYSQNWVYNPIGNITQFNGVNYTYHPTTRPHAVMQVGSTTYTYDTNGNMTTRGADAFTYDAENRLTQVAVSGGVTTTYTYNADGARVKRAMGSTTTYYIGNWYEVTQAGAVTKYYYFGGKRVAVKQGSAVYYLHTDHLGSTSITTDASRNQVGSQTYYTYGAVRTSSGALQTDYTFTGQKLDSYIKLLQMGARWYDYDTGRFTQPDTIIPNLYNPQSLNRYAYVINNPVKYTDPTGHAWCDDHVCQGDIDDPLGYDWQGGFWREHGRAVSWQDVQVRLFSLAYPKDYNSSDFYDAGGNFRLQRFLEVFRDTGTRTWDNLEAAINRLSQAYSPGSGEQIARDIASLWGGMSNRIEEPRAWVALAMRQAHDPGWVWVGAGSMPNSLLGTDLDGNVHHWASTVLGGWLAANSTGGCPWTSSVLTVGANSAFEWVTYPLNLIRHGPIIAGQNYAADVMIGPRGASYGYEIWLKFR